jgi:hypothetical protein
MMNGISHDKARWHVLSIADQTVPGGGSRGMLRFRPLVQAIGEANAITPRGVVPSIRLVSRRSDRSLAL